MEGMSLWMEESYPRVVALLVLLELVSVYFLWSLNPVGRASSAMFALFLATVLVAFSMTSYVYRTAKMGDGVSRGLLLSGCCLLLVLLFAGFLI
jgi:hypothetical protein